MEAKRTLGAESGTGVTCLLREGTDGKRRALQWTMQTKSDLTRRHCRVHVADVHGGREARA